MSSCFYNAQRTKTQIHEQPCDQKSCIDNKQITTTKGKFCTADPDTYNTYCHQQFLVTNKMPLTKIVQQGRPT